MLLVCANVAEDDVIAAEEIGALRSRLDLEVVHVLQEPPDGWQGETGRVDGELLDRHLLARPALPGRPQQPTAA